MKVKPEPRGGGGGGDPNPDDPDYGEGGPYWGKGRKDKNREREKKPTKEDMISKIASRVLPRLEVKNAHELNAIALKRLWDSWLTQERVWHLELTGQRSAPP
eukprot:2887386-Amphidinium_carterae.1